MSAILVVLAVFGPLALISGLSGDDSSPDEEADGSQVDEGRLVHEGYSEIENTQSLGGFVDPAGTANDTDLAANLRGDDIPMATVLDGLPQEGLSTHNSDGDITTQPEDAEVADEGILISGQQSSETLIGTSGDDSIYAFGEENVPELVIGAGDTILGGGGADISSGSGSADFIAGEDGDDTLVGGFGEDTLLGGHGDDVIHATATPWDSLLDADEGDKINAGAGDDEIHAGNSDVVFCGQGEDTIFLHGHEIAINDFEPDEDVLAIAVPWAIEDSDLEIMKENLSIRLDQINGEDFTIIHLSYQDQPIAIIKGDFESQISTDDIRIIIP